MRSSVLTGFGAPLLALSGLYWFSSSFFLAKRSLPFVSDCDEAARLLRDYLSLTEKDVSRIKSVLSTGSGCWMDRRIDSLVILVVDALRFDFARHHLPLSIGSRLHTRPDDRRHIMASNPSSSQLLNFIADPPTVTMQRLKGLTTGGLPTFADISASFGGATVDEDSWLQQLVNTKPTKRGPFPSSKLAFVGDDTWIDLFPTQFDDANPFPSFNTRDLDTVDNGCLKHLPRLLQRLRHRSMLQNKQDGFEVIVAHFLGVDHVGHTYGPHNRHMDDKLRQMDAAIATVLELLDESDDCHAAMIFGDHGMTEEGNHGGGTQDEVNAALFVHFSPGCGDRQPAMDITGVEDGTDAERAFQSIHQIDLVPTISILLGIPIPYANIGGLVPSLLPPPRNASTIAAPYTAAALALNAAQVWRYFIVYSSTANKLPSLKDLQSLLDDAVASYQSALAHPDADDAMAYRITCGKFKLFLSEASELGRRVWTRFDTVGMAMGGFVLCLALVMASPVWSASRRTSDFASLPRDQFIEILFVATFMVFQCLLLTFSNSYIDAEQGIVMFALSTICFAISRRGKGKASILFPLGVASFSRLSELVVSGHGLDPSIPLYLAHRAPVFLLTLLVLAMFRYEAFKRRLVPSALQLSLDLLAMLCLAVSWWERRSADTSRNGYTPCFLALLIAGIGTFAVMAFHGISRMRSAKIESYVANLIITILSKLSIGMMAVTGPSMSSSVLIFLIQSLLLFNLSRPLGRTRVSTPVLAALWRLLIRHTFFATNHACAFNQLQYSAAFVASSEFEYFTGGMSLFINTFGWEIVGLVLLPALAALHYRPKLLQWYCLYQWLETLASCVSVTVMRRHLMVWAVFAPRFIFSAVFLALNAAAQMLLFLFSQ